MTTDTAGPYIFSECLLGITACTKTASDPLLSLVSGASRGIGLNLVFVLTERIPSATIFAGARDPASSTELNEFAEKHPNVKVIKLIADDLESNKQAVEEIKKVTGRLDIVVANAGKCKEYRQRWTTCLSVGIGIAAQPGPIQNADPKMFNEMFQVNTLGPLYMYQATYPLLIESRAGNKDPSAPAPKFFITSSLLGSLGAFYDGFIVAPYGVSKAAVNYLALSIHHQTKDVGAVVIPYHPGKLLLFSHAAVV